MSTGTGVSVLARAEELRARRVAFVRATVVRAEVPTSARAGDEAIVLADGSMEGFVGGQCARESVRTEALRSLVEGETVLLRVLPEVSASGAFPESAGARVVVNPCLSGGALEIFLQPMLPPPLVAVVGDTPVAEALLALGEVLGYATVRADALSSVAEASAVVVASHGTDEAEVLGAALRAGAPYVGLVASRVRGAAVLAGLDVAEDERARVHTPAGLDLGARTAPEVALSILAEVVSVLRAPGAGGVREPAVRSAPAQAVDPVCGMSVTVRPETAHLLLDGVDHWFCNPGCRDAFAAGAGH